MSLVIVSALLLYTEVGKIILLIIDSISNWINTQLMKTGTDCAKTVKKLLRHSCSIRVMENLDDIPVSTFYGKRFTTLASAAETIANARSSNSGIDVVIIPPEPDYQTDEEEFDEDDLVTAHLPHDIPGEIEIAIEDDSDEEYNMPTVDAILVSCEMSRVLSLLMSPKKTKQLSTDDLRWFLKSTLIVDVNHRKINFSTAYTSVDKLSVSLLGRVTVVRGGNKNEI
ncbi:hypothetical protein FQR65_LT13348 [Abscondita terminalis]|nr:hypothetical protein FQR65_LT13348 [Abscondita terminalis]